MTNQEKLEEVKKYLDEQGIKYTTPKKVDYLCDLYVPEHKVAVHIENEKDVQFFQKYRRDRPMFIREEETLDLVMMKIQSVLKPRVYNQRIIEKAARAGVRPEDYWKIRLQRHKEHLEFIRIKEEKKKLREERMRQREERKRLKKEKAAAEQKPKRKRQRIVRYEKV